MVLRRVEDLKARGVQRQELATRINEALTKYMKINSYSDTIEQDLRKDNLSHFILRLAYCRTEELRRWFLSQECVLFRHRLESLPPSELARFITANGLSFQAVDAAEKASKRDELLSTPSAPMQLFERTAYYKIPFTQAVDLVSTRQVYISGGIAYVPSQRLVNIVVSRFRMGLSRSLVECSNGFANVASDSRFGPLLQNMNRQYTGREYNGASEGGSIHPGELDALAQRSMPLCMQQLHVHLKQEHKLRHWGRLQYGLFLKGAGLSVDDAMMFNSLTPFTKIMGLDAFTKNYAYNIRHMYGKEGKRTNYTPYSCIKIIMGLAPTPGDPHGCPYRHYDESHLSSLLSQLRIGGKDKDAIMNHAKGKSYQLACQRHFEATHAGAEALWGVNLEVGNHPNAWMQASMGVHAAREATKKAQQQGGEEQLTK
ncbi:unnamed protein product [Chrysoparadoxa australica]